MTTKKFKTAEEKRQANLENSKKWYHAHKNDPEFKLRRKYYQAKYYSGLPVTKQEFLKEYNTDYAFYIKSIRTGKLEKKITKSKEQVKKLQESISQMEERLTSLRERFGHLEKAKNEPVTPAQETKAN